MTKPSRQKRWRFSDTELWRIYIAVIVCLVSFGCSIEAAYLMSPTTFWALPNRKEMVLIAVSIVGAVFVMFLFRSPKSFDSYNERRRQELIREIGALRTPEQIAEDNKLLSELGLGPDDDDDDGGVELIMPYGGKVEPKPSEAKPVDFVNKLVEITLQYVESYYKQTQSQADRAFGLCWAAAAISLIIIASGIIAMLSKATTQGAVVTGVGAFGELIAAVFFYLYNRTILKMSEYHQKLVLTQNVALALKISELLPDAERAKSQVDLIKSLSKDINKYLSPTPDAMPGSIHPRRRKPPTL